jgi:hypothetical protein
MEDLEIWLGPLEYEVMRNTLRIQGFKSQIEHFGPHDYPRLIRDNRPVSEYAFRGYPIRRSVEPGVRVGVTCGAMVPAAGREKDGCPNCGAPQNPRDPNGYINYECGRHALVTWERPEECVRREAENSKP